MQDVPEIDACLYNLDRHIGFPGPVQIAALKCTDFTMVMIQTYAEARFGADALGREIHSSKVCITRVQFDELYEMSGFVRMSQ